MEDQELLFDEDTPLKCSVDGCNFETKILPEFTEHVVSHLDELFKVIE